MIGISLLSGVIDLLVRRVYKHFAPAGALTKRQIGRDSHMTRTTSQSIRIVSAVSLLLLLTASFLRDPQTLTRSTLAASREPVRARHGIVASTNEVASRVGVDIMKRGGNAVDAAIAVAFALAVTHPAAGNLGGGGFMMIRLKNGKTTAIDYREMAPAAAHRNVYLDKDGNVIKGEGGPIVGYRAAGVPGTVRGMELALKKYGSGRLSWSQLVEPARRLAANGFTVTHSLARSLRGNDDYLSQYPETRRIYLNNGNFYKEGELFRATRSGRDVRTIAASRSE